MKTVTRSQAEKYLAAVKAKYAAWNFEGEWESARDGDKPTLVWDWNGDKHPAIVWEGNSPDQWAIYAVDETYTDEEFGFRVLGVSKPAGVLAEPYFSFVLMLYPEDLWRSFTTPSGLTSRTAIGHTTRQKS